MRLLFAYSRAKSRCRSGCYHTYIVCRVDMSIHGTMARVAHCLRVGETSLTCVRYLTWHSQPLWVGNHVTVRLSRSRQVASRLFRGDVNLAVFVNVHGGLGVMVASIYKCSNPTSFTACNPLILLISLSPSSVEESCRQSAHSRNGPVGLPLEPLSPTSPLPCRHRLILQPMLILMPERVTQPSELAVRVRQLLKRGKR